MFVRTWPLGFIILALWGVVVSVMAESEHVYAQEKGPNAQNSPAITDPACTGALERLEVYRQANDVNCELLTMLYDGIETGECRHLYREAPSTYKFFRKRICSASYDIDCPDTYDCRALTLHA